MIGFNFALQFTQVFQQIKAQLSVGTRFSKNTLLWHRHWNVNSLNATSDIPNLLLGYGLQHSTELHNNQNGRRLQQYRHQMPKWQGEHGEGFRFFIHWGRGKTAASLQTAFSNSFSWMKTFDFQVKFHWNMLGSNWHEANIGLANGEALTRRQAIIWTNDGIVH